MGGGAAEPARQRKTQAAGSVTRVALAARSLVGTLPMISQCRDKTLMDDSTDNGERALESPRGEKEKIRERMRDYQTPTIRPAVQPVTSTLSGTPAKKKTRSCQMRLVDCRR